MTMMKDRVLENIGLEFIISGGLFLLGFRITDLALRSFSKGGGMHGR
jgi:hypothetical protein